MHCCQRQQGAVDFSDYSQLLTTNIRQGTEKIEVASKSHIMLNMFFSMIFMLNYELSNPNLSNPNPVAHGLSVDGLVNI